MNARAAANLWMSIAPNASQLFHTWSLWCVARGPLLSGVSIVFQDLRWKKWYVWYDTMVWYYGWYYCEILWWDTVDFITTYSRYCLALFDPAIHSPPKLAQCSCRHPPKIGTCVLFFTNQFLYIFFFILRSITWCLCLLAQQWLNHFDGRGMIPGTSKILSAPHTLSQCCMKSLKLLLCSTSCAFRPILVLPCAFMNILSVTKQILCMRLVSIGSVGERCCIAPKGWIYLAELAAFHAPVENESLPCGRVLHRLPSWFNLWQMLWLLWAALSYQNPLHLETC